VRLIVTLFAAGLSACAARSAPEPPAAADPPRLELAGEYIIPPQTTIDPLNKARFGGISGLAFDPMTGDLLGVSDDREVSRFFVFRVAGEGRDFRVNLHAYLPLGAAPAGSPAALDAEGIVMTRSGQVYISSEGSRNTEPRIPPAINIYNRRVDYVGSLPVPEKFIPPATGPAVRGVRPNAAFESLTITPDERRLFTATELPLIQDGEPASFDRGGRIRILEYVASESSFVAGREFLYETDALQHPPFPSQRDICGVVELLAVGPEELLVMERCFAEEIEPRRRTQLRIRIYRASLAGATDVAGLPSLRGQSVRPVPKTLLLDLATVRGLSLQLQGLDNFEGMAFGPRLADGSRSLLIVSDDNFNKDQRTAFLLFRIRGAL
jgi:hypothetical protein